MGRSAGHGTAKVRNPKRKSLGTLGIPASQGFLRNFVTVLDRNKEIIDRAPSFYTCMRSCGYTTDLPPESLRIIEAAAEKPPTFDVAFDVVIVDIHPVYKGSMYDSLHHVKDYAAENALMVVYLWWDRMPTFLEKSPDWDLLSVDDFAPKGTPPNAPPPASSATETTEGTDIFRLLTCRRKSVDRGGGEGGGGGGGGVGAEL